MKPIRIKRVYEPPAPEDGVRILVDRLWPRGMKKTEAAVQLWLKSVAPSDELRTWYGHDPARWPEFREKYLAELREPEKQEEVKKIMRLAAKQPVTLLFAARDERKNNAVVLKEFLESLAEFPPTPE